MSFRNIDNHDVYLDKDRKLLHGCIMYMLKDGTTEANIYNSDYTPLSNPQITDALGRSQHQVFIRDDVLAYYYKYIGNGSLVTEEANGIDTSDQSKWVLQYTSEDVDIDERHVSGEASMGVPDMATLRSIDPTEVPEVYGNKIICLHGYYSAGDKEPVWYIWDSESNASDDNGSVIKTDEMLVGRWILVQPTEHCDSRHFGIFPQDSQYADVDQEVRITQLFDYCNSKAIRPFFNGSVEYPYFIYGTIRVQSRGSIDVSDGTIFVDKTGSLMGGEFNGNPKFLNRNTTVTAKTVRLSWQTGAYPDCQVFYIDTDYPAQLSDLKVIIETSPNTSTQIDHCQVESNHMIDRAITIQNCELKEEWFSTDYDWSNLASYGNTLLLDNFYTANTYITLKNKQNEANYGDLGEQTVTGVTLLANCIAENASFSNVTLTGNTELHNVSGSVTISGSAYTLNFVDCWLSFTNTSQIVLDNVMWRRGSVSASARIQLLTNMLLDDVDVNASFYTPGIEAQFFNCNIRSVQYLFRLVKVMHCMVYANITQYPEAYVRVEAYGTHYYWDGEYFGNTFVGNACIVWAPVSGVDYTSLALGTSAKVCNNLSDHAFIDDSLWNGLTYYGWDAELFRYQNNSGGCPVFEDEITYTIPYRIKWANRADQYDYTSYCSNVEGTTGTTGVWLVSDARTIRDDRDITYDVYWIINLYNVALPVNKLFRLPYLRRSNVLLVEADVNVFIRPDGYDNWPFYTNEFHIPSTFLATQVLGNAQVAHLSTFRPMKYHYCGTRYCDHDDSTDWESSLRSCMYWTTEDPSKFGFVGEIKYRFKFGDFGKTTPAG